jgi:hypothetical protein
MENGPAIAPARDRAEFSVLGLLDLTEADYQALRQQGFVSAERRGPSGVPYYRLRWRMRGRQQVRGLGRLPAVADRVRQELAALQDARRAERQLRRAFRTARALFREAKGRLKGPLAERGIHFHGYETRRRRRTASPALPRSRTVPGPEPCLAPATCQGHSGSANDHDDATGDRAKLADRPATQRNARTVPFPLRVDLHSREGKGEVYERPAHPASRFGSSASLTAGSDVHQPAEATHRGPAHGGVVRG